MINSKNFTDQKSRIATEEDLKLPWRGYKDGSHFRCYLCGYKFKVGDVWRWVYANFKNSSCKYGNFIVCAKCDGSNIVEKRSAQEKEAEERFWSFLTDPREFSTIIDVKEKVFNCDCYT